MEILTKFNIGDRLSVIDNHKVNDFTVTTILVNQDGISYRGSDYHTYDEEDCFASRKELMDYILRDETENTDNNPKKDNDDELI